MTTAELIVQNIEVVYLLAFLAGWVGAMITGTFVSRAL